MSDSGENELTTLERDVLLKALSGNEPVLRSLRLQLPHCRVTRRESSSAGFFSHLRVDRSAAAAAPVAGAIGDVHGHIHGLEYGAAFVVFIAEGYLELLEGATFDEAWPGTPVIVSLDYVNGGPRTLSSIGLERPRA